MIRKILTLSLFTLPHKRTSRDVTLSYDYSVGLADWLVQILSRAKAENDTRETQGNSLSGGLLVLL